MRVTIPKNDLKNMPDSNLKILVVKPLYQHIPIGMAYVLGCLEKNGTAFDFLDLYRHSFDDLKKKLNKGRYFAVATGGLVGDFKPLRTICHTAKTILPQVPLIIGGGITHDLPAEQLLNQLGADYLVLGEAESSLPQLLEVLTNGHSSLENCRGLAYRHPETGAVIRRAPRRLDLEREDPRPGYEHIDIRYYMDNWVHRIFGKIRVIPILTGRGCKGHCAFCSPTMGRFRARAIANVIDEIKAYQALYDPEAYVFLNEIMFETEAHILDFCAAYKKIPDFKPWICLLRADLDPSILPAMRAAGCMAVNTGLESGSDRILMQNKKGTTSAQTARFLRKARQAGIIVEASAMLGCEGETIEDLEKTIDMHIAEKVLHPAMQFCVAYPGTRIFRNAVQRGQVKDPQAHLEKLQLGMDPNDPGVCERFYLNISAIDDHDFWPAVFSQYRRYTCFLYENGLALNVQKQFLKNSRQLRLKGTCPACGCRIEVDIQDTGPYLNRFFNESRRCPDCKIQVFFNPYRYEDLEDYARSLNHRLKESRRLVIHGTNPNAAALFLYPILGISWEHLLGFVDTMNQPEKKRYFYFPRLTVAEATALYPDLILNLDFGDSKTGGLETDIPLVDLMPAGWTF